MLTYYWKLYTSDPPFWGFWARKKAIIIRKGLRRDAVWLYRLSRGTIQKPPWGGCYALRGWRPWLYSSGSSYREFVWEAIQCFHRVVYWACKEYQSSQAHSYFLDHTTRCMIQPYIRVHLKMDALTHIIPFGHHRIKVLRSLLQNLQGVQLPIPLLRLPLPLDCLMLHETH